MGKNSEVNEPGLAYMEMERAGEWQLLDDLWGNTRGMRDARIRWLPRFSEPIKDYDERVSLNWLYALWRRTVRRLVAKPYSRPVTWLEEGLDAQLVEFLDNLDGMGTTVTQFSRAWFEDGVRWGLGHALVDFSSVQVARPENAPPRRDQLEQAGARPRAFRISPRNLIDWRYDERSEELVEIRYRGSRTIREGFVQERRATVTHFTDTFAQVYVADAEGENWDAEDAVPHNFGRVPLVTWYTNRTGAMAAEPPLLELAEANANHWQVNGDYNSLLYVVSQARLLFSGMTDAEVSDASGHTAKRAIVAKNERANAKWVEHTGAALGSLSEALQKIEDRAAELSARPTSRERSPVTATGEIRGEQDAECDLLAWVDSQEDALRRVLDVAAEWLATELPEDFELAVHRGFELGPETGREIDQLQKDAKEGRISTLTYLRESQRRGLYSDDMDAEEESRVAEDEAARRGLAMLGGDGEPGQPEGRPQTQPAA